LYIEQTCVVKAPREKVFQAVTGYEAYPQWQTLYPKDMVTKRDGNTAYLDMEIKLWGRKMRRTEKHILTPPEQILIQGESGGLTNTSVWKFESIPGGTQVTATMEGRLPMKFRVLAPLIKRQFRALGREWMDDLTKYVEAE
jgi:ribosome-associated toxin RatA of RatAB toxin-antitoxin module